MAEEDDGGGAKANNCYIRSDEFAWIPARLVEQGKDTAKVSIPQYAAEEFILSDGGKGASGFKAAVVNLKDYPNRSLPLQNVGKTGSLTEVDDMCDLPYLHEVRSRELLYCSCFEKKLGRHHNIGYQVDLHLAYMHYANGLISRLKLSFSLLFLIAIGLVLNDPTYDNE
jgi:hypothetical protein